MRKNKIITPEIAEFLQSATLLEESKNREIRDLVYIDRSGDKLFNASTWRWLHPYLATSGSNLYYYVDLMPYGKRKVNHYRVHRLVARVYCYRDVMMCDMRTPWSQLHVHHINHNSLDNRAENLMIMNQRQHQRLHHKIGNEIYMLSADGSSLAPGLHTVEIDGQRELIFVPMSGGVSD